VAGEALLDGHHRPGAEGHVARQVGLGRGQTPGEVAQGDLLVVGVNTDAGIRRLKGPKRPIINEHDRISVLEELESIDYLVPFDDDTPMRLIERIKPDVLVKGADYAREAIVGADWIESRGGRVLQVPLVNGFSTSALAERLRATSR
jgi:D-beta-D-heptose 7-phosphate kinase/D-beta-D-heptose 1-phosphate adenosyltransferase